ncbi:MAG: SulP family inorganic anion transporter [Pseudomonadota bacterium]
MAKYFDTSHLRGDIFGGITAGIVALPLALAFGVQSGLPDGAIYGLWGAILVGFFAALFGGTNTQVSGPTGPMIVVFAGVVATIGADSLPLIFAAVVLAGLIQIALGVLRIGQYINLVPYPVVSGFMSGIGVIIISLQLPRFFGLTPDEPGPVGALRSMPEAIASANPIALLVGGLALAIIFLWPAKIAKWMPGALAALIIATVLSLFVKGAPLLGNIPVGFPDLVIPQLSMPELSIILKAAITLALLGSIDSLLTSLVADNMTRTKHQSNRELIGQGIGNAVAGLFGSIPGAGATMRTVVNIRAGGMTRLSGMIHSLLLLTIVLVAAPLAEQIPQAVLAGILFKVGYDIIDWSYLRRAHKGPRWDLALMLLVLGLTVFVDLITAVGAGVVLAALAYVKKIADIQLDHVGSGHASFSEEELVLLKKADGKVTLFDFGAPLSFGAAANLGHQVREHTRDKVQSLILDFSKSPDIDLSAARAVETIACDARAAGKRVYITGMTEAVKSVLSGLKADHCVPGDTRYDNRLDALRDAVAKVLEGTVEPDTGGATLSPAPAQ